MKNVTHEVKGNKLVVTIDLSAPCEPSKSGKSLTIGSTEGNIALPGGISLGVNCYKPNPGYVKPSK